MLNTFRIFEVILRSPRVMPMLLEITLRSVKFLNILCSVDRIHYIFAKQSNNYNLEIWKLMFRLEYSIKMMMMKG